MKFRGPAIQGVAHHAAFPSLKRCDTPNDNAPGQVPRELPKSLAIDDCQLFREHIATER